LTGAGIAAWTLLASCFSGGSTLGKPCFDDAACSAGLRCSETGLCVIGAQDSSDGGSDDGAASSETTAATDGTATGNATMGPDPDDGGTTGGSGLGAGEPCDVSNVDPCGEGLKCSPAMSKGQDWDQTLCVPAGSSGISEACTHNGGVLGDDCTSGALCVVDGMYENPPTGATGSGKCMGLCAAHNQCSELGDAFCADLVPGTVEVCAPRGECDPLAQNCGMPGFDCVVAPNEGAACLPTALQPGNSCWAVTHCSGGEVCVSGSDVPGCTAGQCCAPLCDLGDPAACASCADLWSTGTPPPGLEPVGYCGGNLPDGPPCGFDCALLVHFDSGGGSTFQDSSPNAYTLPGLGSGLTIDTSEPVFGAGALGSQLSAGIGIPDDAAVFNFGGDFTIDFWLRAMQITPVVLWSMGQPVGASSEFMLLWGEPTAAQGAGVADGHVGVFVPGAMPSVLSSAGVLNDDLWHHVAVVRAGDQLRLFIDGQSSGVASWTAVVDAGPDAVFAETTNGQVWFDELRVRNQTAEWTTDFTPPSAAYVGP
jgi:hypothetical protein